MWITTTFCTPIPKRWQLNLAINRNFNHSQRDGPDTDTEANSVAQKVVSAVCKVQGPLRP